MAVWLIDTVKQKNGGIFPLVDSNDIMGGLYSVNTIAERDAIPLVRRKVGMICFVSNYDGEGNYFMYQLKGGIENDCWQNFVVEADVTSKELEILLLNYALKEHTHDIYVLRQDVWTRNESYNKWEVYNINETYSKQEVWSKEQSYSKEEIDAVLDMLETGGSNFVLNSTFLRDEEGLYISDGDVSLEPGKLYVTNATYIDFDLGSIFSVIGAGESIVFSTELSVLGVSQKDIQASVSIFDEGTSELFFTGDLKSTSNIDQFWVSGVLSNSSSNCKLRIQFPQKLNFIVKKPMLSTGNSPVVWSPSPQDGEAYVNEKIKELLDSAEFIAKVQQELQTIRAELDGKANVNHTHTNYYLKSETYSKNQVDNLLSSYSPGTGGSGGTGGAISNYFLLKEVNKLIQML